MGPFLSNELLFFSLFLLINLTAKDLDPQITSMRTGQSSYNAPEICQVLLLLLLAMNLNKAFKFFAQEVPLEK